MKKRLFFITLALVVLVVGINLFTRAEFISNKVRAFIVEKARQELGYEVGMDSLVLNFFPAYIDLERPYIKGWDPDKPQRVISADSVRVYFSLAALMNRRISIRRAQFEGARLHIVRQPDGGFNTDALLEKLSPSGAMKSPAGRAGGSGTGPKVDISQIVLFDADLRYDDKASDLTVMAANAGVDLRLLDKGVWVGTRIKDITVIHPDTPTVNMELEGEMRYQGKDIEFRSVKLVAGGSHISGSGSVELSDKPRIDLDLDARMDLGILRSLALVDVPVSGTARLEGEVMGEYPELSGKGGLRLADASYSGLDVERLGCEFVFDKGVLSVDGVKGEIYGGTIDGSARVDFTGDEPRYSSSIRLDRVLSGRFTEPDESLRFIPWYEVSGVANAEGVGLEPSGLRATGTLTLKRYDSQHDSPEASAELAAIKLVELDFLAANSTLNIKTGHAAAEHTDLEFKGSIGFDGQMEIALSGRSTDIEDISTMIGYPDMDGELDFTGFVTGYILDPLIKGKARISNAYAGGVAFPTAFGDVELSRWRLSFSDFLIRPEQGSLNLNGSIYFQGKGAAFEEPYFDAVLELKDADARELTSIFYEDIPVNLTATGDMSFRGNTLNYEGKAHLVTGVGDVYGQKLDKGEVEAELDEDGISFPKVIAVRDRDIATASGRIGFDGTFHARATSAKVNLENFDMLAGTGVPVKGSVSVSVEGGGRFDDPVISATVAAYTLYMKDVDLGAATLETTIRDGLLSGKGSLLDDRVTLEGFLQLSSPYSWYGKLAFKEGRFEPFVRMVYDRLPEDVSFVSTGTLTAQGAVDAPENDSATLNFSDVTATIMGRELKNQGDISMSYLDGGLVVRSLDLKGEGMSLKASGTAHGEKGLEMDAAVSFDLDVLRELYEDTLDFVDGRCDAELSLSGPVEDPIFTGRAVVSDAGVKFKDFPQRFDNVSAELSLEGKVFELKSMKAEIGGGTVAMTGRGGLKGITPDNFSFTLTAQDVKVKYPENLTSIVQAKLFMEGVEQKRSVTGDIFITNATYTERVEWKSWLLQFKKEHIEVSESAAPGVFGDVALNIHVTGPQNIKIDNNVAKVPVTPDFYVSGTIGNPVILGRLEATSGKVYFRNNAFTLINAVAEFADPTRLNPIIDLQAETQVREYTIQLTLSGTLDRIRVTLLSDPPLEDADIVTLLTLGRTSEGLAGHEAAITTGEAASFVTGQIQDAVEERVRRLTGFDRFQIDPYLTSTGASSGPRLTVGKSLFSEKLYITYSSNLGTSEDQYIRLEYLINKNLSLVGERDELGRFGGDVKLRFDFK